MDTTQEYMIRVSVNAQTRVLEYALYRKGTGFVGKRGTRKAFLELCRAVFPASDAEKAVDVAGRTVT